MNLEKRLGRYEVLGPLGRGGFGRVWLARAPADVPESQQLVAIKRLRMGKLLRRGQVDRVEKFASAFRYEAELSSYLEHPNIVRVIEVLQTGKHCSLVMEFINGLGLDELLAQQAARGLPFPPDLALEITLQAAEGLHYAHTACAPDGRPLRLVHRDIKPGNLMICRQGRVRVMDFGVARSSLCEGATTAGTIKGTLRYLSPEQADGSGEVGPASDQFALALVLAEMLLGYPVYDAEREQTILLMAVAGRVGASVPIADRACPGVGPILARALAFMPQDRYPSIGAFINALKTVAPPTQTLLSLGEWIHRGLEERARSAMNPPEEVAAEEAATSEEVELEALSGGLLGLEDSSVHSGSAPLVAPDWEMLAWADLETDSPAPHDNPDAWIMVPGDEGEDWRPARRTGEMPPPWAIPSSTTVRRPALNRA